ncbi:hypothetical protein OUZ56_008661 [Daphnia magna]|uniref:Uncharacterized protein n=1 Tax=Daphnia magna TaxID=35525 RepID=A0ABR0ADN6_9CRUS|nr:hypothetical protein OUZ56_008661 [Daphnia magna]
MKLIVSEWVVDVKQVPDKKGLSVAPMLVLVQVAHVSPSCQPKGKSQTNFFSLIVTGAIDHYEYLGDGREGAGDSDSIDFEPVSTRLSWRILESLAEEADASLELDVRRRAAVADSSELLLLLVVDSFPIYRRSRSSSLIRTMIYLSGTSPSRPSLVPYQTLENGVWRESNNASSKGINGVLRGVMETEVRRDGVWTLLYIY